MTSNEIAVRLTPQEQWSYAKALAQSDILPVAYREKPANVLVAMEFGRSLNLNITQIFTSVHVIEGKPSMGAELMSALTRQAGHRLRVSGNDQNARCSIWRSDDLEFEYLSEWDIGRAVQAGLCTLKDGKPYARSKYGKVLSWESYPAAMLRARAISECCRMAVPDVLNGVSYTREELEPEKWVSVDADPEPPAEQHLPAATPAKQPRSRKAATPPAEPDVVEGSTEPSMSAEPVIPPQRTGDLSAVGGAEAEAERLEAEAERLEWRAVWLGQLDEAIEAKDLDGIQALGTAATQAGAEDLVEDARNAWSIVTGK